MSKGTQVALGASVIALLLAWYTATNLEAAASFTYFQDLDDFRAVEAEQVGASTRVHVSSPTLLLAYARLLPADSSRTARHVAGAVFRGEATKRFGTPTVFRRRVNGRRSLPATSEMMRVNDSMTQ